MVARLIEGLDPARCFLCGDTPIDASAGFGYLPPENRPLFDRVFGSPGALQSAVNSG